MHQMRQGHFFKLQMDVDNDPQVLLIKFKRCLIIFSWLTFEHVQQKFPQAFINITNSRYNFILSEFSTFKTKVSEIISRIHRVDPRNQRQAPYIKIFVDNSVSLRLLRDQEYANEPDEVIMSDQIISEPLEIAYLDLSNKISSMDSELDRIKNTFPTLTHFTNTRQVSNESRVALNQFIDTGILIRGNEGDDNNIYNQSIIKKIEDMILNFDGFVQSHFKDILLNTDIALSTYGSFIALAVPSMEGKTQSAFVFRDVKPLYFPLSGYQTDQSPQPVYKNFAGLSAAILSYAGKDLDLIGATNQVSIPTLSDFSDPAVRGLDLWTLGFLCKLVENGRNTPGNQWMRHHAETSNFSFEARSLDSIDNFNISNELQFFHGFVLFLDEFFGDKTGLYLRNLARSADLRCLVSNTNTRIANLTIGLASGGNGETIWSQVVCELNSPATNAYVNSLAQGIGDIIELGRNDPIISIFFNDFLNNQVNHLRPGVANFLKTALEQCVTDLEPDPKITICKVLDHVVKGLSFSLTNRKSRLYKTNVAFWAKISLLFETAYVNLPQQDLTEIQKAMHHPAFLENHLFNLVNPWRAEECVFMTFAGVGDEKELSFKPGMNQQTWSYPLTYFKESELFTILGCLAIPFVRSVTFILNKASASTLVSPAGAKEIENPRAFKLPGNALEISAVVSVADSTQHHFLPRNGSIISTYSGQYGAVFIKNLIVNLFTAPEFTKFASVIFHFPGRTNGFDLENDFLAKCHMPFIYGVDHRIPILDEISNTTESSVYFGIIERTPDSSQVDSKFSMRFGSETATVTAECKNRRETLDSGKLEAIIAKAIKKQKSKLCLVFCNSFYYEVAEESKFVKTCSKEKVNVYRVKRGANINTSYSFIIEQFGRNCPITEDPQTVCIVFEADRINPDIE